MNDTIVILDYAHTPEALKTVLENLKEQFPEKKISIVFGCGGDRDKKKSFFMGKIASLYCNNIYLTDDNPRNENPNLIRSEIKKGIRRADMCSINSVLFLLNQVETQLKFLRYSSCVNVPE